MKKLLMGLSVASLFLLASCGGNNGGSKTISESTPTTSDSTPIVTTVDTRAKLTPVTDDTGAGFTKTTGLEVFGYVNQTKKDYETLITIFKMVTQEGTSSKVENSTIGFEMFTDWAFYTLNSSDNASSYKHIVIKYTFDNFNGLYYEYNAFNNAVTAEGGTINWYTNNNGGYRAVALLNKDYSTGKIVVDWDNDGYRKNANITSEGYTEDGTHFNQIITIAYSYSK